MSACPRCNAAHDGLADKLGWSTCRQCAFVWQAAARPVQKPAKRAASEILHSDEYAPDSAEPRTAPLAVRDGSAGHRVLPATPATPEAPRKPAAGIAAAAAADAERTDVDSQLFDRLEQEAQSRRAAQPTLPEIPAAAPGTGTRPTAACPVCGHRFPLAGDPPPAVQSCPQCATTFNALSGQLAAEKPGGETVGESADWIVGRTIRGCYIDRKIGEGGMGAVYHARQLSLDRSVAIKVMPAELARNKNFIQRFEREAKSLARINHPNILHIYDFGDDPQLGIYFMIIEFVDGKDLGEVLRTRETISQEEMLDILRQSLLGLEMASDKGVIHRDIKPDNLMISKDGICKVSDFGLAKGYGAFDDVTSAGVRVGTPAFMSPEQCDGAEVDSRSDVYSLGCTAYLALTSQLPFNGDSPFSIMLKHKTEPPPPLRSWRSDLDPRVDDLVRQMLAKRPSDRCSSLRELIDRVEELQVSLAGGRDVPRKSPGERPRLLNDSGAVRLLPDASSTPMPVPPLPDDARLPEVVPEVVGESLPPVRFDGPPARASTRAPPPAAAEAPVSLQLQPDLPRKPPTPRPTPPPPAGGPASVKSSATIHVEQGDRAAGAGRASEAVRNYQEALKRRPSREVGAKLADARRQQRHGEADQIEKHGDDLAAAGREEEAIDEWMRASQMQSRVQRREELLQKVDRVQQRRRRRRLARRLGGTAVLLALLVGNVFLWTPRLHDRLLVRELEAIAPGEPGVRAAALRAFVQRCEPWHWYVTTFQRGYALPVRQTAQTELDGLVAQPQAAAEQARQRAAAEEAAVQAARRAVEDARLPWKAAVDTIEKLLPQAGGRRAEIDTALAQVRRGLQAAEAEIEAIAALRAAGRHGDALARVREFPQRHPRGGGLPLPRAGRLVVTAEGREGPVAGLAVAVDGVALVGALDAFCRDPARPTVVEVGATGFLTERRSLPPGGGEDVPLQVQLRPGRVWQTKVTPTGPWWRIEPRSDAPAVMLVGPRGLLSVAVNAASGETAIPGALLRSTLPVAPAAPDPVWTAFDSGEGMIAASSDGIVARLAWDGQKGVVFRELARKGTHAVTAWIERELTFQPGKRAQIMVEAGNAGAHLVAVSAGTELWRRPIVSVSEPPFLIARDDRLCVVDDRDVRLFEEDGTPGGTYAIAADRVGRAVSFDRGRHLAIPTVDGVELIRLGGQPQFLETVREPALGSIGGAAIAAEGADLLVADGLGQVRLLRASDKGITVAWKAMLPPLRKPVGHASLGRHAVVVDDQNHVHLYARETGAPLRRYELPLRPAVPPVAVHQRLMVLDVDGVLTAYYLPD